MLLMIEAVHAYAHKISKIYPFTNDLKNCVKFPVNIKIIKYIDYFHIKMHSVAQCHLLFKFASRTNLLPSFTYTMRLGRCMLHHPIISTISSGISYIYIYIYIYMKLNNVECDTVCYDIDKVNKCRGYFGTTNW